MPLAIGRYKFYSHKFHPSVSVSFLYKGKGGRKEGRERGREGRKDGRERSQYLPSFDLGHAYLYKVK